MPFKSEKQRKYLFTNKPDVAKKFVEDEKKGAYTKKLKTKDGKKSAYTDSLKVASRRSNKERSMGV